MLKALLIFNISIIAGSVTLAAVLGVPYDWIIATVLLVEVVPIGTFGAAIAWREMKRATRIDWMHPAPRQRLPAPSQHPQLEAPQQRQIEAPRREVEVR